MLWPAPRCIHLACFSVFCMQIRLFFGGLPSNKKSGWARTPTRFSRSRLQRLELYASRDLGHALVVAVDLVGDPASRGAEARIPRLQPVRIDRPIRLARAAG